MPSQLSLPLPSRPRRLSAERAVAHADALVRLAYALCGSQHDAEDIVQDVFLRVLARPRLMLGDELAYLSRCVRNEVRSRWRQSSRRPRSVALLDDDAGAAAPVGCPVGHLEAQEVFSAIAQLPDAYRDVLALVDVAGLSYQEAASTLGVPVGTVMSRLYRGRGQVVRRVDGEERMSARPQLRPRPTGRKRRPEYRSTRGVLLCEAA